MNGKPRSLSVIADAIKNVIITESNLSENKKEHLINSIDKIKEDCLYTAPELMYMRWCALHDLLVDNFNTTQNMKPYEDKIFGIFTGKIEVEGQYPNE